MRWRDTIQYNWYQYARKGFTERQQLSYARAVRYYTQAVRATPRWQDPAELWDVFLLASVLRKEGARVEVDHIVPLNHPYVCGLHCTANLQLLPAEENNRKSSHWWPDSWEEGMQQELKLCYLQAENYKL